MRKDTVLHYIKDYAVSQPDTLAVCELRKNVTYSQYWQAIRRTASVLTERYGVTKGEHVMIRCTQNIDFLVAFSALQYLQAFPIPVEKTTSIERMTEVAEATDATALISDATDGKLRLISTKELAKESAEAPEAELPLAGADDRSMLLFTTGTTGTSKGVICLHRNDVTIAENIIDGTHMRPGNVEIIPMPLNHAFGLRRYQSDMVNGGTVCLMDGMVFVGTLWKLMDKYQATSMALSPATLGMIFQLSGDRIGQYRDQLDYIQIGSAPLVEADKDHLLSLMPDKRLYNFYGSSEAGCSCILDFNSDDNKPKCIGRPTVNSLVRFSDIDGNVIPQDQVSEDSPALLAWGGPIVMEGYYKAPEITAQTVKDGFVMTKDLAYLDEEGRVILMGRADDIINFGGSKISPAEVEDCARSYDGIADCACASRPDPITGEVPVMLVIPGDGYDEAAFRDFLAARLEDYKLPQAIICVDSLPKTFKGTLLRKDVKKIIESLIERGEL